MREGNPFGVCCYCGRQILWIRTKAGNNMPVNPEVISYRRTTGYKKDAERIVTQTGEVVCADRVENSQAEGFGYISHFATCKRNFRRRK